MLYGIAACFADLRDTTDGDVGRKAEPLAQFLVAEPVQHKGVTDLPFEGDAGQPGCRFVESLDRRLELGGFFGVGKQLGLDRKLHAHIIAGTLSTAKSGGGNSTVA
jgi:hypothetical protein